MIRYLDCQFISKGYEHSPCEICSLSSYGRDCRNNPVEFLPFLRSRKGLTQKALADTIGVNISQIQKLESGERKLENTTFKNGLALAEALGISPLDLLEGYKNNGE